MSRQLAFGMRERKPSRDERKRAGLKEEILRFAAKVRPSISSGRDSWAHTEISNTMARMKTSEIIQFKKRIQRGEEDGLFPGSRILERDGEAAAEAAEFLGEKYIDAMLGLARSRGDIDNVAFGKKYLEWAAGNGNGKVKARALAGIALVAADEVAGGNGNAIEKEIIKKRGIMSVLSKEIGEKEAWAITRNALRMQKAAPGIIAGISILGGACAASAMVALQEGSSSMEASMAMAAAGVAGALGGLVLASGRSMRILQGKIGGILHKKGMPQ